MIENNDTKKGRRFDLVIQSLIIFSLISFCAETLPDLTERQANILWYIETVTVIIFTIEYLLRIFVSTKPFKYIFSFFGLIDLLAILPFYLALHIDLRSVRIFRLIRILRMIKIVRYKASMTRFRDAFLSIKEELLIFITITSFLLFVSSVGIYYFEHEAQPEIFKSIFHSMWFSVITLSTVGYGDMYPITVGGKFFTSIMVLIGLGIIAVPTGLISSALTKVKETEHDKDNTKK
jgi:voltage-gated potassium channel